MSTLAEIREAIVDALADCPARFQVSLVGGDYDEAMEKFTVRALVGEPSPETEEILDGLIAADGPVTSAFATDPTLGGVVQLAAVRKHSGHRAIEQPDGPDLLGTEFLVEIHR